MNPTTLVEQKSAARTSLSREEPLDTPGATAARLRFFMCLAILVVAAAGMQTLGQMLEIHFRKQALELKRPLFELDVAKLAPAYTLYATQPKRLEEDAIQSLGTKEFHNWNIEDQRRASDDPARQANVFISYYTGKPDMVPHNPKECMQASGYDLARERIVEVKVDGKQGGQVTIPVSVLTFVPPGGSKGAGGPGAITVVYFFYVNGGYVTERNDVRRAMQRLSDRYAYYSKVEVSFFNEDRRMRATEDAAIGAIGPLLQQLMPVLWSDHFQDWDGIVAGAAPAQPQNSQ